MALRPIGTLDGSPWNAAVRKFQVDASNATAIFPGDAIKLEDDGNVAPAAAGNSLLGVCVGVVVSRSVAATEHPGYLPASTAGEILVCVGRSTIYSVDEDHASGDLALTNVGSMGDLVAGAGSTTTGISAHKLDSSDVIAKDASPGSAQFLVIGQDPTIGNSLSNANGRGTRWLVIINESQLAAGGSGL